MGAEASILKNYHVGQPYTDNADEVVVAPAVNNAQNYTVFQYPKQSGKLEEKYKTSINVSFLIYLT